MTGLELSDGKVRAVQLATGETVACGIMVNAAGPRAQQVAAMAGLEIPVAPYKRYSFVFASETPPPAGCQMSSTCRAPSSAPRASCF